MNIKEIVTVMFPEDIVNKIMLYTESETAKIIKQSSIFKFLQLRELQLLNKTKYTNEEEELLYGFNRGRINGYQNKYNNEYGPMNRTWDAINSDDSDIDGWSDIDSEEGEYAIFNKIGYNIGFNHSKNIKKLTDEDYETCKYNILIVDRRRKGRRTQLLYRTRSFPYHSSDARVIDSGTDENEEEYEIRMDKINLPYHEYDDSDDDRFVLNPIYH